MKTVTVRLPDQLAADLEAEARKRNVSVSDIMRERLQAASSARPDPVEAIRDLIGSVDDDLPADLSARANDYLKAGYGLDRRR